MGFSSMLLQLEGVTVSLVEAGSVSVVLLPIKVLVQSEDSTTIEGPATLEMMVVEGSPSWVPHESTQLEPARPVPVVVIVMVAPGAESAVHTHDAESVVLSSYPSLTVRSEDNDDGVYQDHESEADEGADRRVDVVAILPLFHVVGSVVVVVKLVLVAMAQQVLVISVIDLLVQLALVPVSLQVVLLNVADGRGTVRLVLLPGTRPLLLVPGTRTWLFSSSLLLLSLLLLPSPPHSHHGRLVEVSGGGLTVA